MASSTSSQLFGTAQQYMPGGVNSPVRAFKSVGLTPLFIKEGKGATVTDVDNNQYIDYVCSWGPLILGHGHPEVIREICRAADKGTSFGAPCEQETRLAQMICEAIPSVEMVRMVNSGTEATMSAVRLARAYTGRDKIVKFAGCYHGHADTFLIKAGSGLMTSGVPTSPGIPQAFAECTLVAEYNHIDTVKKLFDQAGSEIAAVIVEPVAGNMGLVPPDNGFLHELRQITKRHSSLLIFDEVITGFRLCYGGFQNIVDIEPDITTLGKIIGGGLPVGAYGGRKEIMSMVAPQGDVYQAGTLSGNPLAMAAGAKTLEILQKDGIYQVLQSRTQYLVDQIKSICNQKGVSCYINHLGSMFSVFFNTGPVVDYNSVIGCNTARYAEFFKALLGQGIYFPPSQFEVCFVSLAHDEQQIDETIRGISQAIDKVVNC
ncbi:MAG: glutamate-1-semialdehyde 2,1-aminomutase [Syntrophomonadaceae bacterium]